MATINNTLQTIMDNPIVIGLISIALTVYGPRLSPKLPDFIRNAFNNSFFRLIVLVLVIFIGSRNIRLSLVLAILFMVLMSITNSQNIKEDFEQQLNEYYSNYNLFGTNEHLEGDLYEENGVATEIKERLDGNTDEEDGVAMQLKEHLEGNTDEEENFDRNNPQNIMEDEVEPFENPVPLPQPLQDFRQTKTNSMVSKQNRNMNNVNQQNVNFTNSNIKVISQMANDPQFGLSNKCKVYFNNLNNNSESCLNEFENKLMDNPELATNFYGNINEAKQGTGYGNRNRNREPTESVQTIKKQISQACKAFKKIK
jgi:hypothetical protein